MDTELVARLQATNIPAHVALKAAMSALSVRQWEVAERLGISEGALSRLLTGRRPLSPARADEIAAVIRELAS